MSRWGLVLLIGVAPLAAQSVRIHSEFQRIDPFGNVVDVDRSAYPREILSPEVPRNAHSIFHVSVTVPENNSYFLYIGANPDNLVGLTLYKEDFVREGGAWIPDLLTPLRTPAFGTLPDTTAMIPGQTTRCYLLDIWVPAQVEPRRLRVEVLLKVGIWYVAPMELRIGEARVPPNAPVMQRRFSMRDELSHSVDTRIDDAAMTGVAGYLFGSPAHAVEQWASGPRTVREAVRRSVEQDLILAREYGPARQEVWSRAAEGIVQRWMRLRGSGAEWYLRVRDWIYRTGDLHGAP